MLVNRYAHQGPENIRSIIGWCLLLLLLGFVVLNALLPNNDFNIAVDTLLFVLGIVALAFYIGPASKALWRGSQDPTDYLIVGIALSWISQDIQAPLRVITRLTNFDPVWVNSEVFALAKLMSVVAAVLHIIPKDAIRGAIPKGNGYVVAASFMVAAGFAAFILVARPDPRPWIHNHMPWWSRDMFGTGVIMVPDSLLPP